MTTENATGANALLPQDGGSNAAHGMGLGDEIKATISQAQARGKLDALLEQLDDAAQDVQLKIAAVRRTIREAGGPS
jgi:hypothetical protein